VILLCHTIFVTTESTPTGIERALTLDILRGRYPVGSRLPTVRELAAAHEVNPATIQRVVSRLETRGLIEARQGSGLKVLDPSERGDLSLVPYWLEATLDQPERAAKILEEFLEVRRVIATRLMVRHRGAILEAVPTLRDAADALARARGLDALRTADMAFARGLLRATGNVIALAVLSTLEQVLEAVPSVAQAMYAEPKDNAAAMLDVLGALMGDDDPSAGIEAAIAKVDAATIRRFEASMRPRKTRRS